MDKADISLYCFVTSLLWGATNPLIKKSTKDIVKIQKENNVQKFFYELMYLVTNWKYMFLFCLNQAGSILYIVLLQNADLSLVVPAVNALTFFMTAVTGVIIKESAPSIRNIFGVFLILLGIASCMSDKFFRKIQKP